MRPDPNAENWFFLGVMIFFAVLMFLGAAWAYFTDWLTWKIKERRMVRLARKIKKAMEED